MMRTLHELVYGARGGGDGGFDLWPLHQWEQKWGTAGLDRWAHR